MTFTPLSQYLRRFDAIALAQLRAELDAAYFHLYGIERNDAEYILTTFTNTGLVREDERSSQQLLWSPGSTGERILEAYDQMAK